MVLFWQEGVVCSRSFYYSYFPRNLVFPLRVIDSSTNPKKEILVQGYSRCLERMLHLSGFMLTLRDIPSTSEAADDYSHTEVRTTRQVAWFFRW